jgi:nuclear pore complex protein Nup93
LNADLPGEAGKQQASLCHEALRELVLETREFSTLLGDLRLNGNKVEGLIQERLPLINLADQAALIKNITQEAAKTADDNGRTNDAVLLCHLAEEYDAVVQLLNRALAEALSVELGQEPLRLEPLRQRAIDARSQADAQTAATDPNSSLSLLGTDDPVDLALRVMTLYDNDPRIIAKVDQRVRDTLLVLYRLNEAKKLIEAGQYMRGLDVRTPSPCSKPSTNNVFPGYPSPTHPSPRSRRQPLHDPLFCQYLLQPPDRTHAQCGQFAALVYHVLQSPSRGASKGAV